MLSEAVPPTSTVPFSKAKADVMINRDAKMNNTFFTLNSFSFFFNYLVGIISVKYNILLAFPFDNSQDEPDIFPIAQMYSTRTPLELHPNPVQEGFKWSSGKVRGSRGRAPKNGE